MFSNVLLLLASICCTFAYLVPNHYLPWPSFHGELCFGIGFVLLALCGACTRASMRWPPAAVMALMLSFVPICQYAFGLIPFSGTAVLAYFYLSAFALSVLVGRNLFEARGEALLVSGATVLLVSALVTVGLLAYQLAGCGFLGDLVVGVEDGGRLRANLAQPNHVATLLFLGFVSALFLYEKNVFSARALVVFGGLSAFGVALTQSRTGLLECSLIPVALFVFRPRVSFRSKPGWLVGWFCLLLLIFFLFPSAMSAMSSDAATQALSMRTGSGTRPQHWLMLVDAIKYAPISGYGWDQVSVAHLAVLDGFSAIPETQAHAHNILLDLVLWNGLPIGVFVIFCALWFFVLQVRQCVRVDAVFLLMAVFGVLTHGLLEYPLDYLYFLLPLGFMIGVLDVISPVGFFGMAFHVRRGFASVFLLFALVLGGALVRDYIAVEGVYRNLRLDAGGFQRGYKYVRPRLYVLTNMQAFLDVVASRPSAQMSPEELGQYDAVLNRYPYTFLLLKGALAYGLNGDAYKAERSLRIICKRYPEAICDISIRQWKSMVDSDYPSLKLIGLPLAADGRFRNEAMR